MASFEQQHQLPVRVYYEDTDAGGIVYYVNYLKFMERGRTEWLRSLGFEQKNLPVLFVVRDVQARYRKPAHLDDALTVHTQVQQCGRASLTFVQQVLRGAELLCEAQVQVACIDARAMHPCALPAPIAETFMQLSQG